MQRPYRHLSFLEMKTCKGPHSHLHHKVQPNVGWLLRPCFSSHASCCIIQQFFQDTNFFRDDFLVVTAFQFVKGQTLFSLLYVVPSYHITFKTKVNYFPLNRQLFCNFPTFSNKFPRLFPNFIKDSETGVQNLNYTFLDRI